MRVELWVDAKRDTLTSPLEAALLKYGVHVGDAIVIRSTEMRVTARAYHQWEPVGEVVLRIYTKLL